MTVYAFDFDGTITTKDTFIEFIRFAKGDISTFAGFMLYAPILAMMKLKLYPNWKAKQQLFAHFFKGTNTEVFETLCERFAKERATIIRPQAFEEIRRALQAENKVLVITASIDKWVRPFFDEFGEKIQVLGTNIESKEGKITGKFISRNCYGKEKVNRLKEIFPNRNEYELIAFGDSKGDKELLENADKGYFKPFRGE